MAISLLVAFIYGSMVWGIFPLIESVSWEAHLTGMAAGIVFAFFYRQYGPPPNFGRWRDESDEMGREDMEDMEDGGEDYLEELRKNERAPDI